MKNLKLAPSVQLQLEQVTQKRPQVLILHGIPGVGLYSIASHIAHDIAGKHAVITIAPDEKGIIKIDIVRSLYDHARVKHANNLAVVIDDADAMQASAQNALLKLLEDTPASVFFILTSHNLQLLLPTIRSRAQEIDVLPIDITASLEIVQQAGIKDKSAQAQLLFLAEGRPAEMARLMSDQEYLTRRSNDMRVAKEFLSHSLYQKLIYIYKIGSDREVAITLLRDVINIVGVTLKKQPSPGLASLLETLLQTEQKLHNDGHVRTQLMNLAVLAS